MRSFANRTHILLSMALACAGASPAIAGAGKEGGGGTLVFRGEWNLADLFRAGQAPGAPLELGYESLVYIERIQALVERYGIRTDRFWSAYASGPFNAVSSEADLRGAGCVDEPIAFTSSSGIAQLYGCTRAGVSYVILERLDRLDFKKRVLALLHERLHAFAPQARHGDIMRFISGVHVLVTASEEQSGGTRRLLAASELRSISELFASAEALGFRVESRGGELQPRIWANGGGVFIASRYGQISPDTFIGVGSRVKLGKTGTMAQSTVLDSDLALVATGAFMNRSEVIGSRVEVWSELTGSRIEDSTVASSTVSGSTLKDSVVSGVGISSLLNVTAEASRIHNSSVRDSSLTQAVVDECTVIGQRLLPGTSCRRSTLDQASSP